MNRMEPRTSIDDIPDDVLYGILHRVEKRNELSLVCVKWYHLERGLRRELDFGGNAPKHALKVLLHRFYNITSLEINYCYDMGNEETQVDDDCLRHISLLCANLNDISFSSCRFVTDAGLASVALCSKLRSVRLTTMPLVTEIGMLSLVSGCTLLKLLHVDEMPSVKARGWIEYIGTHGRIESLSVENCGGVHESDLAKLGYKGWRNLRRFVYTRAGGMGVPANAGPLQNWSLGSPEETLRLYCPNLERLWLWNSRSRSLTGLLSLLGHCKRLRELEIDQCAGLQDEDMIWVAANNPQMAFLSLTINCNRPTPNLTNLSLLLVADKFRLLRSFRLTFLRGQYRPNVMESGIVAIVNNCKQLESLILFYVSCVQGSVMAAINRSNSLTHVCISQCHHLTDEMVVLMGANLRKFTLLSCPLLTDGCLRRFRTFPPPPTVVTIAGCPGISHEAAVEVARGHEMNWY